MRVIILIFIIFAALILPNAYGQKEDTGKAVSLFEAVRIGLEHNPDVARSAGRIKSADGRFWQGISPPKTGFSIDYEFVPAGKSLSRSGEKTIGITQSFEFPSVYFLKAGILSGEMSVATLEHKYQRLIVMSQIREAYYRALASRRLFALAEENALIALQIYRKSEARSGIGEGNRLERLAAGIQYAESGNQLEAARLQSETSLAELSAVTATSMEPGERIVSLTDSMIYVPLTMTADEYFEKARTDHPLARIKNAEMKIRTLNSRLAWSSFLPDFSVGYFRQSSEGRSGYYGVSFGMSIPLWFMFDQRGKIREAGANRHIAESDHRSFLTALRRDIGLAHADCRKSGKQYLQYRQEILPQAEEMHRIALRSYESGELTYLEYLQARQMYIGSKSKYTETLLDYHLAVIKLEKAAGFTLTGQEP